MTAGALCGEVEVGYHAACVYAGVGAPRACYRHGASRYGGECFFYYLLHAYVAGLNLPAVERLAPYDSSTKKRMALFFEVCVSEESCAVCAYEVASFFGCYGACFHRCGYPCLEVAHEFFGVVLHVVEHFVDGLAFDNLLDFVAVFVYAYVHGVCVAEEVVHITENFLICAHQKHAYVVWLRLDGGDARAAMMQCPAPI